MEWMANDLAYYAQASTFIEFCNFFAFVNAISKIFCTILVSLKFQKCWSHDMKAMTKDKRVNIVVTQSRVIARLTWNIRMG
jgi:hypothetical protein